MKRTIFTFMSLVLLLGATGSITAQESADNPERQYKNEFQESVMTYKNVTVYKVLDQKDAYIVMYAKGHRDVGNVTIPKKWYKGDKDNPKKLAFRKLSTGMSPYMTVLYRDGDFDQVILTMPVSRADPAWGVADSNAQVDADKDTLDIVY